MPEFTQQDIARGYAKGIVKNFKAINIPAQDHIAFIRVSCQQFSGFAAKGPLVEDSRSLINLRLAELFLQYEVTGRLSSGFPVVDQIAHSVQGDLRIERLDQHI